MKWSIRLILPAIVLWSCGCGLSVYKPQSFPAVTGKLLVNGKPLEGAMLQFIPNGATGDTGSARTGPDGAFSVDTLRGDRGLPDGKYKVTVRKFRGAAGKGEADPNGVAFGGVDLIPPQYSRVADSQILLTVPSPNYDINLRIANFKGE